MANDRGAGRKSTLTTEQIENARNRYEAGESIAQIAAEYGISFRVVCGGDCVLLPALVAALPAVSDVCPFGHLGAVCAGDYGGVFTRQPCRRYTDPVPGE